MPKVKPLAPRKCEACEKWILNVSRKNQKFCRSCRLNNNYIIHKREALKKEIEDEILRGYQNARILQTKRTKKR